MTDIAEIGFVADTSDLKDANVELKKLGPNAQTAETGVDKLTRSIDRLTAMMDRQVSKASRGSSANDNLTKSYAKLESTVERVNRLTGVANKQSFSQRRTDIKQFGDELDRLRAKFNPTFAVIKQYRMNVDEIRQANRVGAISVDEMSEAIRRQRRAALTAIGAIKGNGNAVQKYGVKAGVASHNVVNLAAQFQDIGVSASLGMRPLSVALQQGTQISAVLGPLGLAGSLKALGQAFKSVISPVSLITIAMVALVASFIQVVNWTEFMRSALNFVADNLQTVARYSALAAAGLTLMYAPAIIRGMTMMPGLIAKAATAMRALAVAIYAVIGLPGLIVAGLVAVVAAANVFRDELTRIFGFDIVGAAKNGVNKIIGSFVGAFNTIKKTWILLPFAIGDIVLQTVNNVINGVKDMINTSILLLNSFLNATGKSSLKLGFLPEGDLIKNEFKGVAKAVTNVATDEFKKAFDQDYIGGAIDLIDKGASAAASKLRAIAKNLGVDDKDKKKKGKTQAEKFADITGNAERRAKALEAEIRGLSLTKLESKKLRIETQLLNQAQQRGIELTPARVAKLKELATTLSQLENKLENLQGFKQIKDQANQTVDSLTASAKAIGMNGVELEKHKAMTALMAQVKARDIQLTIQQRQELERLAGVIATVSNARNNDAAFQQRLTRMQESNALLKAETEALSMNRQERELHMFTARLDNDERFRGIQLSMAQRQELEKEFQLYQRQRQELETYNNGLNFARETTRGFFQDIRQGIRDGESAWRVFANTVSSALDKIASKILDNLINNLFANIGGGPGGGFGSILSILGFAKGGAFNKGVQEFAKGGAFTNSLVNSPTLFKFAAGQKFGVMGEAGPEAVMPLKRGRDGSLGVQMVDNGNGRRAAVATQQAVTKAVADMDPSQVNQELHFHGLRTDQDIRKSAGTVADESRRMLERSRRNK